MTPGNIGADLTITIVTICNAAEDAPLSIVIIGVGDDAEANETIRASLANGGKLRHSNETPIVRDIVGFAAFQGDNDNNQDADKVVGEAMKDVPEQLVKYFRSNGTLPGPPVSPKADTRSCSHSQSNSQSKGTTMKDDSRGRLGGSNSSHHIRTCGSKGKDEGGITQRISNTTRVDDTAASSNNNNNNLSRQITPGGGDL